MPVGMWPDRGGPRSAATFGWSTRTSAAGQGAAVARAILGEERPYDDTPYFWSDQFGLRLQHVGHAEGWAKVEILRQAATLCARYLDDSGRLLAALLANRPRDAAAVRRELASPP